MRHFDITVQILAGGRSRRMGSDKARTLLAGRTLLERAVEQWWDWGKTLVVSVGASDRVELAPAGTAAVCDVWPGCGPMGGLHGGLTVCATPLLLLRAVDTPFLGPEQGEVLAAAMGGADACVFSLDGRPQPLFGLYRAEPCLRAAQELLTHDERRMLRLLDAVDTVFVPADDRSLFCNLNTPEELRRAEERLRAEDRKSMGKEQTGA